MQILKLELKFEFTSGGLWHVKYFDNKLYAMKYLKSTTFKEYSFINMSKIGVLRTKYSKLNYDTDW